MLSTKHRFLFVHIPKTAGNSVHVALNRHTDDLIVRATPYQDGVNRFEVLSQRYKTTKHSTLTDYRREYGDDMLRGLYKFCCVRNPWQWALSHYFSAHRGPVTWCSQAFREHLERVRPLGHYLALAPEEAGDLSRAIKNVDFVMRYESLQQDFDAVCSRLNLPRIALTRCNRSGIASASAYYDDETRDFIADKYRQEIELFGYSFPG